ncbi:glycosyltransferase family 4 protein [Fusobacterium ulcerans]|uniref:glycosyltransferase family 4 protein n=1 Tax=Fusobacterium ulcerans TaxID=861 RepID=UPI001D0B4ED9|nr:glycosyltransferase family 4 protein [Fusobacterium ulcerans]MCB8565222.1 glycosyltransferase family 4 protein [Fusobacterium ulcerans]MCB8649294.1 glycosyltransferase family 4 protein [Fusobacterium ulcerans]
MIKKKINCCFLLLIIYFNFYIFSICLWEEYKIIKLISIVILLGNIEDKNLLYDYYNRAKVFLLTSKGEGFVIVYPEALRFGNYIITTDVGGAKDITNNGEIGVVTEIENEEQYKKEILKVINKKAILGKVLKRYEKNLS